MTTEPVAYDAEYFAHGCGLPYERSDHWLGFFGGIAEAIVSSLAPSSALDAGCAMGFLVEALYDRGVDAHGVDISPFAVGHVRDDIRDRVWVGSIIDAPARQYDLVVCIEVLEHLPASDARRAVAALCSAADAVLMSSSPDDFSEPTHANVQPPEYWAALFAEQGFWHDVEYDASFITPWAMLFRRRLDLPARLVSSYERKLWHLTRENGALRESLTRMRDANQHQDVSPELQEQLDTRTAEVERLQMLVAESDAALREAAQQRDAALAASALEREALQTQISDLQSRLGREEETALELQRQLAAASEASARHEEAARRMSVHLNQARAIEERLRDEIRTWSEHWEAVQGTFAWRTVMGLRETRHALAPPGTRRESLWLGALGAAGLRRGRVLAAAEEAETVVESTPYERFVALSEAARYDRGAVDATIAQFSRTPTISVVMPVYNTPIAYLREAIESVRSQYYPHWELCICDDASTHPDVGEVLREYAAMDNRIKVVFSEQNRGIAQSSSAALALAGGQYVALLDHDDMLTPDALYQVARVLQSGDLDLIYSDEDKLNLEGRRCDPFFKPAWSPDLLLSCMYTVHLSVYRRAVLDDVGGFRAGFDGSQDYDLALRVTERSNAIAHLPMILYHWRQIPSSVAGDPEAKPYAYTAAERAITEAMQRRGVDAEVEGTDRLGYYRVRRTVKPGKVSILIPTRDRLHLLRRCIDSIQSQTEYPDYEIIIVDNGTSGERALRYLETTPHRVLRVEGKFNYARLNNLAAQEAVGEYLVLLNNDTEVLSAEWLTALVEQAQRPEVGAVGGKLLYPDGRVQHAGVILGIGGVAGHAERFRGGSEPGYFNFPNVIRNCSAVTGACLAVRRDLFLELGGLDEENLAVSYNDIDFCLRLRSRGYLVVYTPYALLRHYESASRGPDTGTREREYMVRHWKPQLSDDPYYNPNLSLTREDFVTEFSKPDSYHSGLPGLPADDVTPPLVPGRTVGQEFTAVHDDLCAVAVQLATHGGRCTGIVTLRIEDSQGVEVAAVETDARTIADNAFHAFFFNPIPDSTGRNFYFYVEFVEQLAGSSDLSIWISRRTDAAVGPLSIDHEPDQGSVAFLPYYAQQPARLLRMI